MARTFTTVVVIACLMAGMAFAQAPATNPAGTLGAGDLVDITIVDLIAPGTPTAFTLRIDDGGNIRVPLVGRLKVAGRTTDAAAADVAKAFQRAKIIDQAIVTAAIREPAATSAVKPGPFATGDTARIVISDLEAPGKMTTVDAQIAADGTVELPLAGKVKFAGLSEHDAADAVAKQYSDKQIIQHAILTVLRTGAAKPGGTQ